MLNNVQFCFFCLTVVSLKHDFFAISSCTAQYTTMISRYKNILQTIKPASNVQNQNLRADGYRNTNGFTLRFYNYNSTPIS